MKPNDGKPEENQRKSKINKDNQRKWEKMKENEK